MNAAGLLKHFDRIAEVPDAVPRLRQFVLELGMRGKLVEQDSRDGLASSLLNKLAKPPHNSESTTTNPDKEPYSIPASWAWISFGAVHELVRGVTYTKSDVAESEEPGFVPILRANNIGTSLTLDEPVFVRSECVGPNQLLKRGDFFVALSSGSKNLVGKATFVSSDLPYGFGGFCGVIRLALPELEGFTRLFLASQLYRKAIAAGSRGIGINNLKRETLNQIWLPLPPLSEQHRIVAKVDELMALCDQLQAAHTARESQRNALVAASLHRLTATNAALDQPARPFTDAARFHLTHLPRLTTRLEHIQQLRRTILNLAVHGRLVPQKPDDEPAAELMKKIHRARNELVVGRKIRRVAIPPITDEQISSMETPVGWVLTQLGDVFDVRDGTHATPKYVDVGYPLITSKNLSSGKLCFDDIKNISEADHIQISERSKVNRDDILLAMIGSIGNPVVVNTDKPFSIKNVALFKYFDRELCCPLYLKFVLEDATSKMKSLATGGLQPFVSLGFLRSFPLLLPPLAEQHRIVAKVDELMQLCDALQAELITGQTQRSRLLEALLHEALNPAMAEAA